MMGISKLCFFPFFLFFFLQSSTNGEICQSVRCGDLLTVDYPFRLVDQPECCGNPNFTLSCSNQSETTINFPFSGEFNVFVIGYSSPSLLISDPDNCMAKRLLQGLNLYGTPFVPLYPESYTFLNCSSNVSEAYPAIPLLCLGGANFLVWAIPTSAYNPSNWSRSCVEIATIFVPIPTQYRPRSLDIISLTWEEPDCQSSCNCRSDNNHEKKSGLSSGAKYALIFGLGIPGFFILVFIIYYYNSKRQQSTAETSQLGAEPQQAAGTTN